MADAMLALPPATPTRRRELIIATAFASGGVVMVMVTLIGAYLSARNAAAAFLNQSTFLFSQVGMEIAQPEGPLFYAVTGTHFAMVIAAMVMIVLMGFRALGGQFSSRQPDGIAAAAVFWDAMVAVYAVVWIAVYVMK